MKIKVITLSLQRVITLSDNLIQILNHENLQCIPNIKLKNIVTFSVSNKITQGASIDMCTSTKRHKLQIYRLDRTNIHLIHEISVQDLLISLGMDEHGILACSETNYFSFIPKMYTDRRSTGSLQTIFTLQDSSIPTCFTCITPGEYLLNGPRIGIPTTLEGTSERAPMMFSRQPTSFLYSHPYLLVLVQDSIHIYSYLDDQLKQEIPLINCQTLINIPQDNLNSILISNEDDIYLLESLTIEEQIEHLLSTYRLQEALVLAESNCLNIEQRPTNALIISTKKRIGLIEFSAMNVFRALHFFDEIHLDYQEILLQIPHFLPLNSPWPEFDDDTKSQYIQWLNALCDYMTKKSTEFSRQADYYSSLLKAYLITKSRETIIEFLENTATSISTDFHHLLFHVHLYHGAAILYSAHEKHHQAIDIWQKIVLKEYPADETFPGIWIIGKYILERNIDRTWEFSITRWLLEQNEEDLAVKIFIDKYQNNSKNEPFSPDRVIDLLKSSYPSALRSYLEQAVFKLMIKTENLHVMLVNSYLDELSSSKSQENNETIRSKLQEFLIKSNSYRIHAVLQRISQMNQLKHEQALLHGKMNHFQRAFEILVNELEDFAFAEKYCVALSSDKSSNDRKLIAHVLFNAFLAALDRHPEKLTDALLCLLCNHDIEFDFLEILKRLPSHWPIALLTNILLRAVRTCSSEQRAAKLELAVHRVRNEKVNTKLAKLKCSNVLINEYRRCKHCFQQFYETSCIVYQDGSQVHVHCAKKFSGE